MSKEVKSSAPALLQTVDVVSNKNKNSVSLLSGVVRVLYWESILGDSVKASVVFTDSGSAIKKKGKKF